MGMDFRGQVRKRGEENDIFWSEIGSGFGEPDGTPPPRIPRCTPPGMLLKILFTYVYCLRHSMCDRRRKGLGEEGKETMIGLRNKETLPFSFCFYFSLPLPSLSCACHTVRGKGGTSGILEWGCAAGTLKPLVYTRASSAEFWYPIRDYARQIPVPPPPPHPRVAVFQELLTSLAQFS